MTFTTSQLQAISAHCLDKAARYESLSAPLDLFHKQRQREAIRELRSISADALFLIDTPDCENTLASLEQAVEANWELDALVATIAGREAAEHAAEYAEWMRDAAE